MPMPWVTRGLRHGILTTRYPRRPDDYGPGYRAAVSVRQPLLAWSNGSARAWGDVEALCPTGAITDEAGTVRLDRGRCILCGRCVEAHPDVFSFDPDIEIAGFDRSDLVVPEEPLPDDGAVAEAREDLARRVKALRRSVHIRHVDAGSDGSEEWEIAALNNPVYDIERLGVFFTASPRHADLLLVTGAAAAGMTGPLRRTWEAMPDPKIVIAAGADAVSGGIAHPSYSTRSGVGSVVPVDLWVPGSPPSPFSLLHAIAAAIGVLSGGGAR